MIKFEKQCNDTQEQNYQNKLYCDVHVFVIYMNKVYDIIADLLLFSLLLSKEFTSTGNIACRDFHYIARTFERSSAAIQLTGGDVVVLLLRFK